MLVSLKSSYSLVTINVLPYMKKLNSVLHLNNIIYDNNDVIFIILMN